MIVITDNILTNKFISDIFKYIYNKNIDNKKNILSPPPLVYSLTTNIIDELIENCKNSTTILILVKLLNTMRLNIYYYKINNRHFIINHYIDTNNTIITEVIKKK